MTVTVEIFEIFPNGLVSNNYETSFESFEALNSFIENENEGEKWHGLESIIDYKILEVG